MPNKLQIKFILQALESPEHLTPWEVDFIDSLADLPEHITLSDKQNAVLNRIQQKLLKADV